jgi:hypothetical protein
MSSQDFIFTWHASKLLGLARLELPLSTDPSFEVLNGLWTERQTSR